MRIIPLLAAALLAAASASAQRVAPRWTLPAAGLRATLATGQRPVVLATINGRGPYRLLIETGSVQSILNGPVFDAVADGRSAGAFTAESTVIGDGRLDGATFQRYPSLGLRDIDGLLGLDAFAGVQLTLDFPGGALRLSADTLPAANDRDILAIERVPQVGFWAVRLAFPGGPILGILDTQSALGLSGSATLLSRLTLTTAPATIGRARGPSLGNVPMQQGRLDGVVRFGDRTLDRPLLDFLPMPSALPQDALILGLRVLCEFTFSLDQRTGRARFARTDPHVAAPPPVYSAGLTAQLLPDSLRAVIDVVAGLGAAQAGIVVGDTIVAVAGRPTRTISDEAWRVGLLERDGTLLRLRRNGVEREVRVRPVAVGF